jgi:phytol kinase
VSFYGMTAMAMMTALCALALSPQRGAIRIGALACLMIAACILRAVVIGLNPDSANWNGPMWPAVLAALALASLLPSLRPGAFVRRRMTKVTLLALVVPLPLYLYAMTIPGV